MIFLSIRLWAFISIVVAYTIIFVPQARLWTNEYETETLLATGVSLAVSLFFSIYGTYSTESVREFLHDIRGDVILWGMSLASLVYLYADTGFSGNTLPLWMLLFCFLATTGDLAFSLNGGASKLLEMDKENFVKNKSG